MNNYQTWLETADLVRIALIQAQVSVSGNLITRYLSTHPATVDGIEYLPVVHDDITVSESISEEYSASISYGDISIANNSGTYDTWLEDIWVNKTIKIYVGTLPSPGVSATLSDFELIFDGVVSDIDSRDRSILNLKLRDKLEKLNTSISEVLLGNYFKGSILPDNDPTQNQYKNNLKPLCFGEVHNITPLLSDPTLLEYMVNLEAVEQIIEVCDNGVPVEFITTATEFPIPSGSFRLKSSPAGTITCSVQGVKRTVNIAAATSSPQYLPTASNTIATILKHFGKQLEYSDLDSASFSSLGIESVGVYLNDRTNVLAICQDIAKSCGIVLTVSRTGKIKLVNLTIPASATKTITEADMFLDSLSLVNKLPVLAGVKLGYAKNWTIQTNLLTYIPQQHKDLLAVEYLESIQLDATVKSNYALTTEPEVEATYLIDKAEADAVALKKLNLRKQPRKMFSLKCVAKHLSLQVGDPVVLQASRFGLGSGVLGLVMSTKPNWLRGYIELEVLV